MKRVLSICLLGLLVGVSALAAADGPNIVLFVTDDQAIWACGAYGNTEIHTPNIDSLAAQGVRFLNAFTPTPVCSPSRATLFTGRYGSELGIHDWINPRSEPDLGLPTVVPTWAEVLRQQGYRTGLFGKWHLGARPEQHPRRRGFDVFVGFLGGGNRPMDPVLEVNGRQVRFKGPLPQILADAAVRFIRDNAERPFVACVCFRAPHTPYGPVPEEARKPYAGLSPTVPIFPGLDLEEVKRLTVDYYASITSVDLAVGRVLAALDALGLSEKTVVIFTSDHGYNLGHHGLRYKGNAIWMAKPHRGKRRPNMYDTSIRVPFLVRWSGHVKGGRDVTESVSFVDLFPTLVHIAGAHISDQYLLHGRDFWPLVEGQKVPWDNTVYGEYDMIHGAVARMRMLRTPQWKLVIHREDRSRDELYHLSDDPGETKNLASDPAYRDVYERLLKELAERENRLRLVAGR